jgi:AhpD family alkylhydroperoxidase
MGAKEDDQNERLKKVLQRVREEYGFIPLVAQVMSSRPDIYLPYSEMSSKLFFNPKHLDQRTAELAAISAGAALGSENCLGVHIPQAIKIGVSEDEILEAMLIGSFMNMNRSNSVAFRCLKTAMEGNE